MSTQNSVKIYEYPKCSTCKSALRYLEDSGVVYRKIDISEQPPTKAELRLMLKHYGGDIRKVFNTSGMQYRALKLSEKIDQMNENDLLELLSTNGKLVKRPFILTEQAGRVGFKKNEWDKLFS